MRAFMASCLALFLAPAMAIAAPITGEWVQTEHTRARLVAPEVVAEGQAFPLVIEVELQPEWHTYWINPGDSGIPTRVKPVLPEGWSAGELQFPIPHRFEMEGLLNFGYSDHAAFMLPVQPKNLSDGATIKAELKMLVCNDVCVPENAELEVAVAGGDADAVKEAEADAFFTDALKRLPRAILQGGASSHTENGWQFVLPWGAVPEALRDAEDFDLFIKDQGVTSLEKPTHTTNNQQLTLSLANGTAEASGDLTGLLVAETKDGPQSWYITFNKDGQVSAVPAASAAGNAEIAAIEGPAQTDQSFLLVLFFALIGGLILNAMPCVFPVLSLKALALAKKAESEHATILAHGIAYTAGVLLCFVGLGVLMLALQSAGRQIGWGFQLQSPGFVAAMGGLFFLLGLNLLGAFELPLIGANLQGNGKESTKSSFLTGLLAALVATPCTAPFMGSAMGAAIGLPAAQAVLVFVALGLGMALPFLLFSLMPALARCLPKPGVWMQRLKEILAFPMLAAALWLLWVLAQQVGPVGLAYAFAALLLLALGVWGWNLVQFKSAGKRWLWLLVIALLWGICVRNLAHDPAAPAARSDQMDYVLPNAENYSAARLAQLRSEGRAVFIDATAAWCLTCKVNERGALGSESVRALFEQHNIAVLVADWTNEDPEITALLKSFGRNGVPIYAFYPADGSTPRLLPQLLTPANIQEGIEGK